MKDMTHGKDACRWYDSTSGMKRAYDAPACLIRNGWTGTASTEGGTASAYILPDGTEDKKIEKRATGMWG